ncbi:MAG: TetR/AcrR family transcriptional regulator [Bacteroidota bacterium]
MGRKSKALVRRQEILSHFYEVIIEEGFEGASIAKIAKRMDVNPSLLIHYFSTKDAMVMGLIDYIVDTYSSHLMPDFSAVEDPRERWDDVLDVVSKIQWDRIISNRVFYSCYTLALRLPEVNERFQELYKGLVNTLEIEIRHASEARLIPVTDPKMAAQMMISFMEGINFYQHIASPPLEVENREALMKKSIVAMLTCGEF